MNSLQEIRVESGMSQWQIAQWLGITRGHYSMAEIGKRSLPSAAALKVHVLYQCLQQLNEQGNVAPIISPGDETVQKTKTRLLKYAARKRLTARALQQKLDDCLEKKQATDRLLRLVKKIRLGDIHGPLTPGEGAALDMFETDAISKRDKMQDRVIIDLQLRINTLEAAAVFAEQLAAQDIGGAA